MGDLRRSGSTTCRGTDAEGVDTVGYRSESRRIPARTTSTSAVCGAAPGRHAAPFANAGAYTYVFAAGCARLGGTAPASCTNYAATTPYKGSAPAANAGRGCAAWPSSCSSSCDQWACRRRPVVSGGSLGWFPAATACTPDQCAELQQWSRDASVFQHGPKRRSPSGQPHLCQPKCLDSSLLLSLLGPQCTCDAYPCVLGETVVRKAWACLLLVQRDRRSEVGAASREGVDREN